MTPREASSVQGMANNAIDLYQKLRTQMPARDAQRQAVSISAQVANSLVGVRVEDAKQIAQESISEYRNVFNRVAAAVKNFFTDSRGPLSQSAQDRAVRMISERRGEVTREVRHPVQGREPERGKGFDSDKFARQVIDTYLQNRKEMGRGEAVGRTVMSSAYAAERGGGISRDDAARMAEKVISRYREATQSMTSENAREAVARSVSERGRPSKQVEVRETSQQRGHEVSALKERQQESRGLER